MDWPRPRNLTTAMVAFLSQTLPADVLAWLHQVPT
jgi:hypothetical protein